MEKLVALCVLWACGFGGKKEYLAELDGLFLENPEDDLLLELECLGGDLKSAFSRLYTLIETSADVDVDKFGKELFSALKKIYNENLFPLKEFGEQCYRIWRLLPEKIGDDEPFYTLCYADDPLSWGDEKQTLELYQAAFDYYKERK